MSDTVHVAVAVIVDENNKVCISLRHKDSHQGGLWEFPGGKVEQGETVEQALVREIKEELDLNISQSRRFITITHDYQDKKVCLHVRKVTSYTGHATGLENQQVEWVDADSLLSYNFPAANLAIIKAIQLPDKYLITGKFIDSDDFFTKLKNALDNNIKLVQLRLKNTDSIGSEQVQALLEKAALSCHQSGAKLMLNLSPDLMNAVDLSRVAFSGIHADSRTLQLLSTAEVQQTSKDKLVSASCHNENELRQALKLRADFVVLSPVQQTVSHPDMQALGWQAFSTMIENMPIPVYALGGVSGDDLEIAWHHGAQGVAAISAFWK